MTNVMRLMTLLTRTYGHYGAQCFLGAFMIGETDVYRQRHKPCKAIQRGIGT